jgi:regulator of sigma E protease
MQIIGMLLQFIAGMSLLVLVHEFGHFLAAKAFGIRVRKFYLFFDAWGFRLFRFNYKGTEYGLGWLPLGGYVKMAGMLSNHVDEEGNAGSFAHRRYYNKPVWQRIIVMLSGIMMNLLLAAVIYSGLALHYGNGYISALKEGYEIIPGQLGKQAGLKPGDQITAFNEDSLLDVDEFTSTRLMRGKTILSVIRSNGREKVHMHIHVSPKIMQLVADKGLTQFFTLKAGYKIDSMYTNLDLRGKTGFKKQPVIAINGDPVHSYEEFMVKLHENKNKELMLTMVHDGKTSQVLAHREKDGDIGFSLNKPFESKEKNPVSVSAAAENGAKRTLTAIRENAKGFSQIVQGDVPLGEALNGPVRIAAMFGGHVDWKRFWSLVALLSIGIGFINLMPIPSLDGGQVLMVAIEGIRGKPLKPKTLELVQVTGFLLLMSLLAFVFINDIRSMV